MQPTAKTIKDILFWEYAKLISCYAPTEKERAALATQNQLALKDGTKKVTEPIFADLEMSRGRCAYCCNQHDLSNDPMVPGRGCFSSELHNIVSICSGCKSSKSDLEMLEWWRPERFRELHPALRRKYLRMLYLCLECRGLLDREIEDKTLDISGLTRIFKMRCHGQRVES